MKTNAPRSIAILAPLLVLLISVGLMQRKTAPFPAAEKSATGAMPPATVAVNKPGVTETAANEKPVKAALQGELVPQPQTPVAVASKVSMTELFRVSGPTTGQPLEPKSAAFAKARLEGRIPKGRVTEVATASLATLAGVRQGQEISIPLTDLEAALGTPHLITVDENGTAWVAGHLADKSGTFAFSRKGDVASGVVQIPDKGLAYRLEQDTSGKAVMREMLLSDVICSPLPPMRGDLRASAKIGIASVPPILDSRPGAVAQIYLDFDGETVTDPNWNGGNTIVAASYNLSDSQVTEIFNRVKEDFLPFNINVTTDVAKYNNAPVGRRMRCIITPTNTAAPTAGGVALLNSFQYAGIWFSSTVPCWVFNSGVTSIAEAVSHEIGHTLGLSHDGRTSPTEAYFEGHGSGATSWAPIMGVGYYVSVVQWSKGEYQNASQPQDDLAIITGAANGFGYAGDEAGGTRGTAAPLAVAGTAVNHGGVITSAADIDFYSFTTSGGSVNISATLGMPSPNLDAALEIQDESGNVVAANNPAGSLAATVTASLGAGSYYLRVSGSGAGDTLTSGYSTYGSIGGYSLTGTINGFQATPEIVVESPSGTEISSGGSRAFGVVQVGSSTDIDFTIKNVGLAPLLFLSDPRVYRSGSADFQVIAQPASSSIPPNGSANFTVRFSPTSNGTITGLLDILHNDPSGNENGFHIHLTGTGSNNVAPTDITLSPASIAENNAANATVGTLSATDANSGDTHSFTLVSGAGSADNASFSIVGNTLRIVPSANFEAKNSYAVRLQATDSGIGNLTFEKALTVSITNVNEMPSFTKGANQTVATTATSLRTITNWATAINDGDSTVVQSLTFNITGNTNPGIFSTQPAVSSNGTLTFTPNGTQGVSTLSVTLTDDSSINGTPALTTATQTFTITVQPPGTGAPDFMDANVGGGYYVNSSVMQPDGKVIVAGYFESVLGTPRNSIARINIDGTLDTGFNPNANSVVYAVAMQPDGKMVVVGFFNSIGGASRNNIARLNPDGTADSSFNAGVSGGSVTCLAMQADGKILLGGSFTNLGAASRPGIARLNSDGTLDTGFSASFSGGAVDTIAIQADGQILVGGRFTAVGGITRNRLARLSSTGVLDATFNPSAGDSVNALAVLPDGKILVGGDFFSLGGSSRNFLGRLTSSGTLDTAFVPNINSSILTMALQADGRIFIGGSFYMVNGSVIVGLARLNSDGTRDTGFPPGVDNTVYGVTCQPDGKLLVGGNFSSVNGTPRSMFARLINDAPAQDLSVPDGSQVLWTRGGAAPDVEQVTFERSLNNGVTWTPLGYGVRVGTTANWQLTGLALTGTGQIRARGRSVGGYNRSSSIVVEMTASYSFAPAPLPIVSAVTPASGGTVGGTSVTITGSNFAPAIGVSFGGTPATTFAVLNATTITATTPAHAAGAVDVSVSTSDNTGTGSGLFTYVAQPEIVVEQPLGTGLTDGTSTTAFGSVGVSLSSEARVYTIRNIGNGALTGIVVTRTGSSDFALNTSGTAASLAPGDSTTFAVSFSPTSGGAKTGAIAIASNDTDENPFDITLTGTGVILAPGVNFIETFANNAAGWTLDTGWAIGSATAGTNDPALDHSPDANNGIAGYVIGGGTGTATFAPRYLTSPVINTNVAGSVVLEFYRWLNADYPPFQMSTVSVWNGSAWIQIYAVPADVTIADSSWTLAQYDVTAHKNPDFRIRFSVENASGALESGSWNIDDLRVYDQTPDIAVEQPVGISLTDGTATSAFGLVNGGSSSAPKVYTVSNAGTAGLSGIAVTRSGSGDFVLNTTGTATSLAPGATTTFSVTFTPTSGGAKTASLAIASNDPDENPFDIALTGVGIVNSAPSDITLTPAAIAENNAPGATVGTLAATDIDVADTHSFAFAGGADDAAFTIMGNLLKINASADFETKNSYSIRVRATDSGTGNLPFEKTLTVAITNVNEAPSISAPASLAINEDATTGALAFTVSDPDAGAVLTVTALSSNLTLVPANAIVLAGSGANRSVTLTPAANRSGTSTITLTVSDGSLTAQGSFVLTVNPVNDVPAFAKGGDQTQPFGTSTAQTIPGWATGIHDGDSDFSQSLTFNVAVTSGAGLFSALPSINAATGTLTYTPNGSSGTAVVSVTLTDDATAGGPALTSAAQTFSITIQHAPEIAVFDGESTAPADERTNNLGIAEFGNVTWNDGSFGSKIFTLQNVGNANLTGLALNVSGTHAADFTVSGLNDTILAPNATTWFVVYFTPGAPGVRNASVQISSNDANENPFGIVVRGTGYVAPNIVIEEPAGIAREGSRVFAWGDGSSGQTTVPAGLNGVVAVAGGANHSLALTSAGKVVAWGGNSSGQATVPEDLTGVTGIAAGVFHSVAVKGDGSVVAWGDDSAGQVTVPPGAQSGVTAVAAGQHHTLALKSNGSVIAWGDNGYGQTSVPLAAQSGVTAIAANNYHSLALKSDGTVLAWGASYNDQTNVPAGLTGVVAIAAGAQHSLALKSNGTVVIWGRDLWGSPFSTPAGLTNVVGITAGSGNSFALKGDGSVVGWTMYGEMWMPGEVTNVALISAGWNHTIAVTAERVDFGSRETGTTSPAKTFTIKSTGLGALSISGVTVTGANAADFTVNTSGMSANLAPETGETTFSVSFTPGAAGQRRALLHVLSDDPDVRSFDILLVGSGYFLAPEMSITEAGGLPLLRSSSVTTWTPGTSQTTEISDPEGFIAISAGDGNHYLALKSDGTVMAWGNNSYQQTDVPAGLAGVVAIAAGGNHSLALKSDGTVAAWGYGSEQLPPGLTNVKAIAAGFQHSLALKSDGTVVAWGDQAWMQPAGLTGVVAIAAGYTQSLALKSNGTVVAWGDYFSQSHVPPAGLSGVTAISARYDVNMALKHDGTVVAWGGQPWSLPTVPADLNGVTAISAGYTSPSFARKSDGSLVAWNRNGQYQYLPFDQSHVVEFANGGMETLLLQSAASTFEARQVGSTSAAKTFTIQNSGTGALSITSVSVLGAQAADFTVNTASLAASVPAFIGSTTFSVSFTPSAAGPRQATLSVRTNDPTGSFLIALSGSGLAPQIVVEQPAGTALADQDTRAFPETAVGASHLMEFTVRNIGNAPLNISNAGVYSFSFGNSFTLAVPPASIVAAGASTTLTVRFQPTYDGLHDAKLFIASNDIENGIIEINLTGLATAPKLQVQTWPQQTAVLNNGTIDFQDVRLYQSATRQIRITNTGEAPLNIGSINLYNSDYMVTSFPSFNLVIQPDESSLVSIAFQPTISGPRTGTLSIFSNDPDVPYFEVSLTGRGIDNTPPVITSNGGGASAAVSVAENTTAVTVVQASDPEVPSMQTLTFSKSGPDAALFNLDPVTGVLNFATPPNFEAPADAGGDNVYHVTVTVADNAVPPASASQALVISVTQVNEAPSILAPASLAIIEDAATGALSFTVADPDAGALLTVSALSSNLTLVPANAIVLAGSGANRSVTVTPVADRHGSALITLTVSDGSLTASGSFTLTVNAVNDAPTFALPPGSPLVYALSVAVGSGGYSASGFASAILPGPPDESSQTVSFLVAADNQALFAVQPAISADGTLTFSPGATIGSATVTVTAKDNGGTANGGSDTSLAKTFVINLIAVPVLASALSENVTATNATLGGEVTSDGNSSVTERGVVLSPSMMNPNPQLGGFGVVTFTSSGTTGAFTVNATNLTPGTAYSFAAYATNAQGTGYTSTGTFSTPSNNADLAGLGLVNIVTVGVLSPAFSSNITSYTASLPSMHSSISVNVLIGQMNQSATVNGVPVTGLYTFSAGTSEPIALVTGPNVITTVVTAQDGTTKTYTITVTRTAPPTVTSPTVTDITTTGATLGGNITSTGFATLMDSGILLAPTATNSNPQLNGAGVIKIPGGLGAGVFTVPATSLTPGVQYSFAAFATNNSEPGSTSYSPVSTFTTISNDASLSSLVLSAGTLSPSFASGTTFYTASVSNVTETLTVTPTAQANATIRVNNVVVPTGAPSQPIALVVGGNQITINVAAQDGFTSQTYFVGVTRLAPPTLGTPTATFITSSGALLQCPVTNDGGAPFTQRGMVYAVTSTNGTPRIGGTGVTQVPDGGPNASQISASLTGLTSATSYSYAAYATNSEGTAYGATGSFSTPSVNASLSSLALSTGTLTPVFSSATTAYSATVPNAPTSTTVTATRAEANATLQVQVNSGGFSPLTSGVASGALPLDVGANSISVRVTAQDGVTIKIYTLTVNRVAPAPTVTGITPTTGMTAGGTSVTLTGTAFTGTTAVSIGGTAATFAFVSDTSLTATTPAGSAGTASVLVTTPGGTNAANTLFTYVAPPTVTLSTANLPSTATTMTITGTNFSTTAGENTVVFTPAGSGTVTTASATSLTVSSLSGLTLGALNAVVTTNGQSSGTAVQVATVVAPAPGDLDLPFNPNVTGGGYVTTTALLPDGRMIIGGNFTTVGGATHANLARLNADGSVDATFTASTNSDVNSVAVQADGKLVLGGAFTSVNGSTVSTTTGVNRIARLNADGTLDTAFNAGLGGANNIVYSMAVQADGKLLLGGTFTSVNGSTVSTTTGVNYIARLNADGTRDTAFNAGLGGANNAVYSVAVQADGKLVLGGGFTSVNGSTVSTTTGVNRIARLNADGTLDTAFNAGLGGANNAVYSVAVQADGKLVFGGGFTSVNGSTVSTTTGVNRIARLNADGTRDTAFNAGLGGANNIVYNVAVQADGKLVLGGFFTSVNGSTVSTTTGVNRIARLNADGTRDTAFNNGLGGANNTVFSVAVQADGKLLLGGSFTSVNGTTRNLMARLTNDAATQSLSVPDSTQALWTRGGAGPELGAVTFEQSTDGGSSWTPLGAGTRVGSTANWQITGLTLPGSGQLRARGRTISGYLNGGSGLIEQVASFSGLLPPAPTVTSITPTSGSTLGGTSVTITGTNFVAPATVTIGGAVATSVLVSNATTITAVTPAGSAGPASVLVTTPGGTNTANTLFTYAETPTVTTPTSAIITATSAVLGGDVSSDGNATVTERGVVLSPSMMNPNPQLGGFGVVTFTSSGTMGAFTVNATNLTPGTAYSFAAYATNAQGTGYTSTGTFSTPSNNADLTYLALINLSGPGGTYNGPSIGTLSPTFFSSITSYTTSVPSTFNSTSINVGIAQANQTVTVNGVPVTGLSTFSGAVSAPVSLVTGPNVITTVVTAQDGTTKTYTITVTRTEPPTVTSPTVADITTTGATLGGNITSIGFATLMDSGIVLAPTATNSNPQLNGAGVIKITGGFGTGVFTVPATGLTPGVQYSFAAFATNNSEPGSTSYSPVSTFTTISNDASLSSLVLSAGTLSPSFASGTTFYTASVSNVTSTLTVTPTAQANATIRVNNVIVPTGSPTLPIPLMPGGNPIFINVTAQDGFTSQSYHVNVTRLAPPTLGTPVASDFLGFGVAVRCAVTSNGGAPVTQRGVVHAITSTNSTPRIGGTGVTNTVMAGGDINQIDYAFFGLTPGTNYSFVAYATNSEGTSYSTTATFTTLIAEIVVRGNAVSITDSDTSPELGDHTDFGSTATTGGTVVRTFTIQSTGTANLTLGSVVIGGPDASSFTVTAPPPTFVSAGQSTTFQVTFDPSTVGLRTATLSFTTNDADENPFNFSIQGTGQGSTAEAAAVTWAESYGLSGTDAAPTSEPFDDGVPNLLKYAFNMPLTGPNVSGLAPGTGNSGLPAITAPNTGGPPDSIRVEFIRRRNSGLIYTPLYSINGLSNFIPMTATPVITTIDTDWERVVVNQPLGLPLPTTTFSRVSVTAQ